MVYRLVILLLLLLAALPAQAAIFYVDQLADDDGACTPGACSLREAALAANALPGVDVLELIPGVHELTIPGINESFGLTGDINFREPVQIRGSTQGATVINGNGIDGILDFFPFLNFLEYYHLSDLTFTGGNRANHRGGAVAISGGRIVIERCVFERNTGLTGGGVFIRNTSGVIRDSSFFDNEAISSGGAIERSSYGSGTDFLIENTTISGNRATFGGAIMSAGAGVLTLRNTTVVDNVAPFASALLLQDLGPSNLVVESSLLEGLCDWPGSGYPPTSLGGNLQSPNGFCFLEHPTDLTVEDFGLGPLEPSDNGFTHALLPGSPAIDAALSCPPRDQRGAHRPLDGDRDGMALCDAGAYELGVPTGLADVPVMAPSGMALLAALLLTLGLYRLR